MGLTDIFNASTFSNGFKPGPEAQDANDARPVDQKILPACSYKTNLLWCAMVRQQVFQWYDNGDVTLVTGGTVAYNEQAMLEQIMSYIGTVTIGESQVNQADWSAGDGNDLKLGGDALGSHDDPNSQQTSDVKPKIGGLFTASALIEGGNIKIYKCRNAGDTADDSNAWNNENGCLNVRTEDVSYTGFQQIFLDMINGTSETDTTSMVYNFSHMVPGNEPTEAQRRLITNGHTDFTWMLRRLSVRSEEAARQFGTRIAPILAIDSVTRLLDDVLNAATASQTELASPYVKLLEQKIELARRNLAEEKTTLYAKYGGMDSIVKSYKAYMETSMSKDYKTFEFYNRAKQ
jgi:hypothetical protein